jgi:glucan endo-1,3-alpha-glucosidase
MARFNPLWSLALLVFTLFGIAHAAATHTTSVISVTITKTDTSRTTSVVSVTNTKTVLSTQVVFSTATKTTTVLTTSLATSTKTKTQTDTEYVTVYSTKTKAGSAPSSFSSGFSNSTTSFTSSSTSTSASSLSSSTTSSTSSISIPSSTKAVFAHFLVGVAAEHSLETWVEDIFLAQQAKIDGFALNVAALDPNTASQVSLAYQAAEQLGFQLFFSFDYAAWGEWAISDVVNYLQTYENSTAMYKVNGSSFVSTFEGVGHAADWDTIRQSVDIYFLPDWTSIGCVNIPNYSSHIDGAFSWNAWPNGPNKINTGDDACWVNNLGGKPFMMSVSPWFYTNIPDYGKNWLWSSDSLWFDRWQEIISFQPDFVEIVSWNDYGESHYIGPIRSGGYINRAGVYAADMPHDGWRALLPYFIEQYKTGSVTVDKETVVYWYRNAAASAGDAGGTVCDAPYQTQYAPSDCLKDEIFVAAVVSSLPAQIEVRRGYNGYVTFDAYTVGVNFFSRPFYSQFGTVSVKLLRNGNLISFSTGIDVLQDGAVGLANYNAYVGVC